MPPMSRDERLQTLEARIGYTFADRSLLDEALTHPSWSGDGRPGAHNQRLEFLGDAVLDLMVSRWLWECYPHWDEGALTRRRAQLVEEPALARSAAGLDLGSVLRLGRSAEGGGGIDSVVSAAFEALIAAIYLDGGLAAAEVCVRRVLGPIDPAADAPGKDPKSLLNERFPTPPPRYRQTARQGSSHAPTFEVEVSVGERVLATGRGRSVREAEQQAAASALATLPAAR
jgi:ribonuclease-3